MAIHKIESLKKRNVQHIEALERIQDATRRSKSISEQAQEKEKVKERHELYQHRKPVVGEAPAIWQYGKSPAEMLIHQYAIINGLIAV